MVIRFENPVPPEVLHLRLGDEIPFAGMNLKDADTSIGQGQSPYMPNMNLDDGGKPTKRRGQRYVFAASKGAGGINGYHKELFNGRHVYAWGTDLYTYNEDTGTETALITGLANSKGFFYTFNDVLYYRNGTDFIQVTSAFVASAVVGYTPTLTIGRTPTGGGTAYEQFNLIHAGFKDSFNGNGSATAYTLSLTGLDATLVTATVNGVAKAETVDFSVNRTTGVVTFSAAPPSGTNNVIITAYKTVAGYRSKITKATYVTLYGGGTNDSRIFSAGNPDNPNVYWYSGLTGNTATDALYYPENNFNRIGSDNKKISAWTYLYSNLLALKEDGIYKINYQLSGNVVSFPASILNRQVGCDMPGSVQIVKNLPVFANTQSGLWTIVNTLIENEKNVEPVSGLINVANAQNTLIAGLLEETTGDLVNCSSFDDGKKYYLCIGDHCWVWDYERSPFTNQTNLIWYYYTNITAGSFAYINREIYYAHRTMGQLIKFQDLLNDFGLATNGVWRSKLYNFQIPERKKDIPELWFTTRSLGGSAISIKYYNENGEQLDSSEVTATETNTFSWAAFRWDRFTWYVTRFAPVIRRKPKLKKIVYFQIEFSNNELNQNLSILNLVVKYVLSNFVK